ncbi:hypothetical protein [Corynebacterium hylobatis]|nr:hypothetical protein [Corynebacterium hylobatis]
MASRRVITAVQAIRDALNQHPDDFLDDADRNDLVELNLPAN